MGCVLTIKGFQPSLPLPLPLAILYKPLIFFKKNCVYVYERVFMVHVHKCVPVHVPIGQRKCLALLTSISFLRQGPSLNPGIDWWPASLSKPATSGQSMPG